jgi:hypothetical protein
MDDLAPATPCGIILYEPIPPSDSLGQSLVSNLHNCSIEVPTSARYPTLAAQCERVMEAGFRDIHGAADCSFIWNEWINGEEKERLSRQEKVDEIEEWESLAKHYSVVWGASESRSDPKQTESKAQVIRGDGTALPPRKVSQPVDRKKRMFEAPEPSSEEDETKPPPRGDGTISVLPSQATEVPVKVKKTLQVPESARAGEQSPERQFGIAWAWAKNQEIS